MSKLIFSLTLMVVMVQNYAFSSEEVCSMGYSQVTWKGNSPKTNRGMLLVENSSNKFYLYFDELSNRDIEILTDSYDNGKRIDISIISLNCKEDFEFERNRKNLVVVSEINLKFLGYTNEDDQCDCKVDRMSGNTPLLYQLPNTETLEHLLSSVEGISNELSKEISSNISRLIRKLDRRRPVANSIITPFLIIKEIGKSGVSEISGKDLMQVLTSSSLTEEEFLVNFFKDLKTLKFSKGKRGEIVTTIETENKKDIIITGESVPVESEYQRKILDNQFKYIKISDKSQIKFENNELEDKQEISLKNISAKVYAPGVEWLTVNLKGMSLFESQNSTLKITGSKLFFEQTVPFDI